MRTRETSASASEACFSLRVFTENVLQTVSKQLCQQASCLQWGSIFDQHAESLQAVLLLTLTSDLSTHSVPTGIVDVLQDFCFLYQLFL